MPDYTDPEVLATLRSALDDPNNWKTAAAGRKLPTPTMPGEFMQDITRLAGRAGQNIGLPSYLGKFARAADDVTTGISDSIGSTGPAAEAALMALRKYLSR